MNKSPGEMPYRDVGKEALRAVLGELATVTTVTPLAGWAVVVSIGMGASCGRGFVFRSGARL